MEHPITPPPEMVRQWLDNDDFPCVTGTTELLTITKDRLNSVSAQAARWGADQKLEACCEWLDDTDCDNPQEVAQLLRAAMRPKPPSLKKQACDALDTYIYGNPNSQDKERTYNTIRRALERLAELENHD